MLIIKRSINTRFTKVDNKLFYCNSLSDGAKALYGFLLTLYEQKQYNDNYIKKTLEISKDTLKRRKKELKEHDLILIKPIGPRFFGLFIGNFSYPASKVREDWTMNNNILREGKFNDNSE